MFEAHLYQAKAFKTILLMADHICSREVDFARIQCDNTGMHWQVLGYIGKQRAFLEFGIEADSFEQYTCTKTMELKLKYMPLLLSRMCQADDSDRVVFKVSDDEMATTNKVLLIELETTTGETRSKIPVEYQEGVGEVLRWLPTTYCCLFVMPSKNLEKLMGLGKKFCHMVGFVCNVDEILSTNDGVYMEKVDTTLIEFGPRSLNYQPLKTQPFRISYFGILKQAQSLSQKITISLRHEYCMGEFKMTAEENECLTTGYVRFHFDSN